MPNKLDNVALNSPFFDRRVKLLPCQKENVKNLHDRGASIRAIARMYNVDKRTVQFTIYPERKEQNYKLRVERGGSTQYYNKEKHTKAIASVRNRKKEIHNKFKTL